MNINKKEAIKLRIKGNSYNAISKKLDVSKSTLSYWLKNIKINKRFRENLLQRSRTAGMIALLKRNKEQTIKALERAEKTANQAASEIQKIDLEKLKLIGSMLYLGEGGKSENRVDFTNSNPEAIKIIMTFFRKVCRVDESKFRIQLSIYDIKKENSSKEYWSKVTSVPEKQFIKVNTTISKYSKRRRKNKLPFGTIQIRISDVKLFHEINGWMRGIVQQIDNVPG